MCRTWRTDYSVHSWYYRTWLDLTWSYLLTYDSKYFPWPSTGKDSLLCHWLFQSTSQVSTGSGATRPRGDHPSPEMLKRQGFVTKGAPYGNHCLLEAAFEKILPFGNFENLTIKRRHLRISFNIVQILAPKKTSSNDYLLLIVYSWNCHPLKTFKLVSIGLFSSTEYISNPWWSSEKVWASGQRALNLHCGKFKCGHRRKIATILTKSIRQHTRHALSFLLVLLTEVMVYLSARHLVAFRSKIVINFWNNRWFAHFTLHFKQVSILRAK